ncbi:MAG TPA: cytochrome c3 family protein [Bdellovibrionales bacterium]|nr:cytochrome c3 family protein [Bdellovibrionales bacterium]
MTKKILGAVIVLGLAGGLCLFVWALTTNRIVIGYNQGYMPDQPINFPHDVHAGQMKIDCKYCHVAVESSRHATVPTLQVCMNCHGPALVQKDSPELQKLRDAYAAGKPVAWEKVTLLPDHVKFNHAPHIKAGKDCTTCHGAVQEMKKVSQESSLSMGWCVNCHRQPENNAPTTCSTCHY